MMTLQQQSCSRLTQNIHPLQDRPMARTHALPAAGRCGWRGLEHTPDACHDVCTVWLVSKALFALLILLFLLLLQWQAAASCPATRPDLDPDSASAVHCIALHCHAPSGVAGRPLRCRSVPGALLSPLGCTRWVCCTLVGLPTHAAPQLLLLPLLLLTAFHTPRPPRTCAALYNYQHCCHTAIRPATPQLCISQRPHFRTS